MNGTDDYIFTPSAELLSLPRIKPCDYCGKGTVHRWPSSVLECDYCGAMGDSFTGIVSPRNVK